MKPKEDTVRNGMGKRVEIKWKGKALLSGLKELQSASGFVLSGVETLQSSLIDYLYPFVACHVAKGYFGK